MFSLCFCNTIIYGNTDFKRYHICWYSTHSRYQSSKDNINLSASSFRWVLVCLVSIRNRCSFSWCKPLQITDLPNTSSGAQTFLLNMKRTPNVLFRLGWIQVSPSGLVHLTLMGLLHSETRLQILILAKSLWQFSSYKTNYLFMFTNKDAIV